MSALMIDELASTDRRWVHVPAPRVRRGAGRSPSARPESRSLPAGRPVGVGAPQLPQAPALTGGARSTSLRLTRRGVAVVMALFAVVMVWSMMVLVGGFLAVDDAPPAVAGIASQS